MDPLVMDFSSKKWPRADLITKNRRFLFVKSSGHFFCWKTCFANRGFFGLQTKDYVFLLEPQYIFLEYSNIFLEYSNMGQRTRDTRQKSKKQRFSLQKQAFLYTGFSPAAHPQPTGNPPAAHLQATGICRHAQLGPSG